MSETIVKWLTFRVALGIVPLVLGLGILLVVAPAGEAVFVRLLSGGQLLLVGGALCGGSIGELLSTPLRHPVARLFCGGVSLLVFVCSAGLYTAVATASQFKYPVDDCFIAWGSVGFYALAIVSALTCVIIAENAKRHGATS
jgi:hypothetical protein